MEEILKEILEELKEINKKLHTNKSNMEPLNLDKFVEDLNRLMVKQK